MLWKFSMAGIPRISKKNETANKYYVCSRCSYHWQPRKPDVVPKNCPSCRSTVWMKPFDMKTCARCGYQWGSTSSDPRRCPGCGTYHWDEAPQTYQCLRCDHRWTAKRAWPPKRCPKCRSDTWNVEKREPPEAPEPELKRQAATEVDGEVSKAILSRYRDGESCTNIAIATGIPFSTVYQVVRGSSPGRSIRI